MGFMILSSMQIKNGKYVSFFFIHTAYRVHKSIEGKKTLFSEWLDIAKNDYLFLDKIHN